MVRKLFFLLPWHKLCQEWIYEVPPNGIIRFLFSKQPCVAERLSFVFLPHCDFDLRESDRTVSVTLGIIKVAFGILSWN